MPAWKTSAILAAATVLVAATASTASTAAAAAGAAPPLSSDPFPGSTCAMAGVGSASLRPLVDAFSGAVEIGGTPVLCDLGAPGVIPNQRPTSCQSYVGTTGGAAGRRALLASLASLDGCLQFAWSTALDLSSATTPLTYIPFADDAVTYATAGISSLPRTATFADLKAIYTCDPAYVGPGPAYTLQPMLPAPGSGVRSRWETLLGITDADVAANKYPCIVQSVNGSAIPENDGRVLGPNALVPYSVAAYLAQFDGFSADIHGSAVLGNSDGTKPVGADATVPDVDFAVTGVSNVPHNLRSADLHAIYTCDPGYVGTGPNWTLSPLLPAAGSAVRTTWETRVGISDADVQAGKYPCVADTVNGKPVPENDGRILTASAIVPFSVSAYVAQMSGAVADVRGEAVVGTTDNAAPLIDSDTGPAASKNWMIVPTSALATTPASTVFSGSTSLVCQQSALIKDYGFAVDPACGDTSLHTQ